MITSPENQPKDQPQDQPQDQRCGFIALIGAPNAGKSTLLNQLIGMKLAIVSKKVQTTRTKITGAIVEENSQLIFVDTPGIFTPKRRLDRAMVSTAWRGSGDADMTILLIDAERGIYGDVEKILDDLTKSKRQIMLALNKIDNVKKDKLLGLAQQLMDTGCFTECFMISALKGEGVPELRAAMAGMVPEGPWLYPEDHLTDMSQRVIAAEITREQIYYWLHQELPYATSVVTDEWKIKKDGSVRVEQTIFVERDSQKGIVIGKGGKTLKKIGEYARKEMEEIFGLRLHLFVFVKVSENWADNPYHYKEIGLDFSD